MANRSCAFTTFRYGENQPCSPKQRAVLEWTEAVTKLSEHGVPDDVYDRVRAQLSETQITELTYAIGVINMWNRLNISFRSVPGSFDDQLGLTKAGLSSSKSAAKA